MREKSLKKALNQRLLRENVSRMNPTGRAGLVANLMAAGGSMEDLDGLFKEAADRRNPQAQVAEWLRQPRHTLLQLLDERRELVRLDREAKLRRGEREPQTAADCALRDHLREGGTRYTFREQRACMWAYELVCNHRLSLAEVVERFEFAGEKITTKEARRRARLGRKFCNGDEAVDDALKRHKVKR